MRDLTEYPFSISLDEGSVKGSITYLVVNARYLPSIEATKTTTKLIGLLQLGDSTTGKTLHDTINTFLFEGD